MKNLKHQVTELLNSEIGEKQVFIKLPGGEVPIKFKKVPNSKELLIIFHGALNREKNTLPYFTNFANELKNVSQLSVSDPSMLTHKIHTASWYAGHEGFESQKILQELFQNIVELSNFQRIVFLGGSAGGFASLFYSSFISKSVAIAANPQTIIQWGPGPTSYRENCWPHITSNEQLPEKICVNLCEWYSVPRVNTIVYVQSAGDFIHTRRHLAPFLATISKVKDSRFILDSGFWGTLGHDGSAPAKAFLPWVRAAFSSQTTEVNDILTTKYNLLSHEEPELKSTLNDGIARCSSDLNLNNLIRDYQLRQIKDYQK